MPIVRPLPSAVLATILLFASPASQDTRVVMAAIRAWTDAVVHHSPGTIDEAVSTIRNLTPEDRKIIAGYLPNLLKALTGNPPDFALSEEASIAEGLAEQMTAAMFLERAATLHADTAMLVPLPVQPPPASANAANVLVLTHDGEVVGSVADDWNWPFARDLLDRIPPAEANGPFIGLWYHATSLVMFRRAEFGVLSPHLTHAGIAVPDDPRILFDRGCLAEALSMSLSQQLLTDDRAAQLFNNYNGGHLGSVRPARSTIDIPPAADGNARAVDLFQRALAIDPTLAEARVRLARLLGLNKHNADAVEQIRLALAAAPDPDVAYFAHLFGARAFSALGRSTEAEAHAEAALALFPNAGSAHLAASVTALLRADATAAVDRIAGLADARADSRTEIDPWWLYGFGAGRLADRELTALWQAVPMKR